MLLISSCRLTPAWPFCAVVPRSKLCARQRPCVGIRPNFMFTYPPICRLRDGPAPICPGSVVRVHSLKQGPKLNGELGSVFSFLDQEGFCSVALNDGQEYRIHRQNLNMEKEVTCLNPPMASTMNHPLFLQACLCFSDSKANYDSESLQVACIICQTCTPEEAVRCRHAAQSAEAACKLWKLR